VAKEKKWKLLGYSKNAAEALQSSLGIHPVLCALLVQRGVSSYQEAKDFFRPQLSSRHAPLLMKDMEKAVTRIMVAMENREKIMVYGDYDVDGTTAVAIVYDFLCKVYEPSLLEFYIPNRYLEGYGLSEKGIDYAKQHDFKLLITLDCGIKSIALIERAKQDGIDTIVCDHHLPGKELPAAVAILNAKQTGCPYPYKELCGCGVGFKLIEALAHQLHVDSSQYMPYLELVATAIAADIVPITGENRILSYHGLQQVNLAPSVGIDALIQLSRIDKKINIGNLSFMIGPRINAAGRMDDAKKAVALFIEKDPEKAMALAQLLQIDNSSRKEADTQITQEAMQMIELDPMAASAFSTVVYNEKWHKGVIGIVASRLLDRFYRPTIVITKSGDMLAGSARSITGFNIHDALEQCSDLLLGYGGHYFAAGMTLLAENLEAFKNRFEEIAATELTADLLIPEIAVDAVVQLKDLTPSFFRILEQMEPYGPENPRPVFCVQHAMNTGSRIVKQEHVRFEIEQHGIRFNGIGFNLAEKFMGLEDAQHLDLVFTLEENTYKDSTQLQLKVIDVDSTGKKMGPFLSA
jgi:single-stranded-DNA-specific exonuclease